MHHGGISRLIRDIDISTKSNSLESLTPRLYRLLPRSKYGLRLESFLSLFLHAGHIYAAGILGTQDTSCWWKGQTLKSPVTRTRSSEPNCSRSRAGPASINSPSSNSSSTEHPSPQPLSEISGSVTLAETYEWLHLCVEHRGILSLRSVDIRSLLTDGPVFSAIHDAYFGQSFTMRLRRLLSFRTLSSVRSVHVGSLLCNVQVLQ